MKITNTGFKPKMLLYRTTGYTFWGLKHELKKRLLWWCKLRFFDFCDFAVSCYGSRYILKAALISAHLFEKLQNFCYFHKHGGLRPNDQTERPPMPNDTSSTTAAESEHEQKEKP